MVAAHPLPTSPLIDAQRARARGLDVERMRVLGLSEDAIATMCDESITEAERLRQLGLDDADAAGRIVARTPDEIEAALGTCARST